MRPPQSSESPRAPQRRSVAEKAEIYVLAGVNGSGKSSVLGARIVEGAGAWFDPDAAARQARQRDPSLSATEANAWAWNEGMRQLDAALASGETFAFETTLGGKSVAQRLERAAAEGHAISILFVGLESPELHLARVKARVAEGGHDIPEEKIRARYDSSRNNLIRLLGLAAGLRLFDNSTEAKPSAGRTPELRELLRVDSGRVVWVAPLDQIPEWAKPIVAAAAKAPGGTPARSKAR